MAKKWWIVWPDGRQRDPDKLPPRPPGASDPKDGGPFTPYFDTKEHRHDDGSFHVEAETLEEAVQKVKRGLTKYPLITPSGRLPAQKPLQPKKLDHPITE